MESVLATALSLRSPLPSLRKALIRRGRPGRRTILIGLLAAAVLGGGFLLFRDSSFVAVEKVQIGGVRGAESAAISQALEAAARRMSTMDYSVAGLEATVARYPVVRSLRVTTSFPHRMRIDVEEQLPVAQISAAGVHSAVAADGVVLGPALLTASLPDVPTNVVPSTGRRVREARLRSYLAVLGAAPQPLLAFVSRIYTGPQGITVKMRDGLLAYFGDDSRPHAKWDSLITVLADPGSAGAGYVDVRLPERPAAGVPQGGAGSGEAAGVSASDPTSAALAASLAKAVNGEPATPPVSAPASPSEPSTAGAEPGSMPATPATGEATTEGSAPEAESPAASTSSGGG